MLRYPYVFDAKQSEVLCDLIDWWTEDYDGATNEVTTDRAHDSVDDLLIAISGMHDQFATLLEIKRILKGPYSGHRLAS